MTARPSHKPSRQSNFTTDPVPAEANAITLAPLRALIVDDEPIARKILREELEFLEGVTLVGEAEDGETALHQITTGEPDVVFLDIQMPGMNGFELLNHLNGGKMPVVVMVTAFDQHAIRAFEAGAVDYLLKPVSQQRLAQALDRARRLFRSPLQVAENMARLQQVAAAKTADQALSSLRKIVGKLGDEYFLLDPKEVLAFQADGDETWIVTARQRYRSSQTLRAIQERLSGVMFRRIHRNAMVNVDQIRKMSMITSQRWLITLNNGQEFVVSKRQAKNVRDVLTW